MQRYLSVLLSLLVLALFIAPAYGAKKDDDIKRPTVSAKKSDTKTATSSTTVKPETTKPVVEDSQPATVQVAPTTVETDTRAGETVTWQVIASGGGMQTLGSYVLGSTVGQTAAGLSSLGDYQLNSGYWQNWTESASCCIERGDVNHAGDGFDISDIVYFVNWLFLAGPFPPCMEEGDANASGGDPDISDLVYLVGYMFQGGDPPVPCD